MGLTGKTLGPHGRQTFASELLLRVFQVAVSRYGSQGTNSPAVALEQLTRPDPTPMVMGGIFDLKARR